MDTEEKMPKGRILVIDDELVMCELLRDLLSDRELEVDYVLSGQEGLEKAIKGNYDVVITDLMIPDLDGIAVLEGIKKNDPDSLVIVITGYPSFDTVQTALRKGAYDYITKPFDIEEVSFVLGRAIAFRKLTLTNKRLMKELEEDNVRLEKKVEERTKELRLLFQVARDVSSTLSLDGVLETIVERVAHVLDVEICSLLLFDEDTEELTIKASQGLDEDIIAQTRLKPGEQISGQVFQEKGAILVDNIETDPNFAQKSHEKYYTQSFISVSMVVKDKAIGVLNVNNKKSKEHLTQNDFRFIQGIAREVAVAIENARLYTSLKDTYLHAVKSLASAIDVKDNYTCTHSEHVAKYAVIMAKEMKLSDVEIDRIKVACELHDLGKIGVHDYILTKPDKLTPGEWEEIKSHPVRGGEILQPLPFLGEIIQFVIQHHERYDGKGYPYGLKGEKIKLEARIMALVDSYDAMITERPYRKALTKQQAIEEIKKNSGSQFDPKTVEVFLRIVDKL